MRVSVPSSRGVLALVLVAFVLRACAAVTVQAVSLAGGGDGFVFKDERNYDRVAWEQAQAWQGRGPAPSSEGFLNAFSYTQAAVYVAVGHHPLAMKLLNCLCGALTAGLVWLMARRLFGHRAAVIAGVAAALFPSPFLWSLTGLKDPMVVFAIAMHLWLLTEFLAMGRWHLIPPLLASFALVGASRNAILPLLAVLVSGAVVVQTRTRMRQKWPLAAILIFSCAALLVVSGGARWLGVGAEQLNERRCRNASTAESGYVTGAERNADGTLTCPEVNVVAWLPRGVIYALAAPFPWTADRAIERATIPDMLAWYGASLFAAMAVARHWRRWREYVHLVGYVGGIVLLLAVTHGNAGTLFRHRSMIIPVVLVFSGEGAVWMWSRWHLCLAGRGGTPSPESQ
jgi:hypothetical protein